MSRSFSLADRKPNSALTCQKSEPDGIQLLSLSTNSVSFPLQIHKGFCCCCWSFNTLNLFLGSLPNSLRSPLCDGRIPDHHLCCWPHGSVASQQHQGSSPEDDQRGERWLGFGILRRKERKEKSNKERGTKKKESKETDKQYLIRPSPSVISPTGHSLQASR